MSGRIKTLVIDDEYLARRRVLNQLGRDNRFFVVGEADSATSALDLIRDKQPELLFLDIEMPALNGFQLLESMKTLAAEPMVVFVTAHSSYALDAFGVEAIDYIRKPFEDERFQNCLDRAAKIYAQKMSFKMTRELERMVGMYSMDDGDYSDVIELKQAGLPKTIKVKNIEWIESYGNYVKLHTSQQIYLYRIPLKEVEAQVNPLEFIRLNRFSLLNTRHVASINYLKNAEYEFALFSGAKLNSTRMYREKVEGFVQLFSNK